MNVNDKESNTQYLVNKDYALMLNATIISHTCCVESNKTPRDMLFCLERTKLNLKI